MKIVVTGIIFLFLLPFFNIERGNDHYDFPDEIVKREFKGINSIYNGSVSQSLSVSGHYRESLKYQAFDSADLRMKIGIGKPHLINGKEFITEKAKLFRIVMINEAHDRPQHRLFTKSILKDLYAQGFNVLMIEGMKTNSNLLSKGYPVDTDGYYINEPTYASMVRYAKRIGYDVEVYDYSDVKKDHYWDDTVKIDERGSTKYISYNPKDSLVIKITASGDTLAYSTSVREQIQAKHIYDIMQRHPKSKFLMHVGYGHLNEYNADMAAKLKSMLHGEDFLTIDQTLLNEQLNITDTIFHTKLKQKYPFFVEDMLKKTVYKTPRAAADYCMFNAVLTDSLSRPRYLFSDVEHRYVYYIPHSFRGHDDYIFAAYPLDEYNIEKEHTIAVDVVYAAKGTVTPPLLLYKGRYALLRKGRDNVYERIDIEVK